MLRYLKKYWLYCLLAPLFMLGELSMDILQPDMMATIVDEGVLASDMQVVWSVGIRMMALVVFGATCGVLCGIFANVAARRLGNDVRKDLFARVMDFSFQQTDRFTTGSLVTRITNDVSQVEQMVMMSVRSVVRCSVTFLGGIYMLYRQSPRFALVAACGLPVIALVVILFLKKVSPMYDVIQQRLDRINCIVQENIAGARVVKAYVKEADALGALNGHAEEMISGYRTVAAYNRQGRTREEFEDISDQLTRAGIRAEILGGSLGPIMNSISNLGFVIVAAFGGYFALKGLITIGVISAFIIYAKQFSRPINEIAQLFGSVQTALAGAERVFDLLEQPDEDNSGTEILEPMQGNISFRHVDFAYVPGEPVLTDFSLEVKAGQKIALVGATGSGKTTVVNLLMRFYQVDGGEILIDGKNILSLRRDWLRRNTAIVLQDTVLFTDTIAANIKYSHPQASDEAMERAARMSNCAPFIARLKDGYQTQLKQAGAGLSHGQRQLLNIARAILADPKILILDEATSSVDTRTEQSIQDALVRLMKNRTSLIIAHRLSTIQDADVIVVMDHGRVVETGNHETLLEKKGAYYALYMAQFAGNAT